MAYREYRCAHCGHTTYAFENEFKPEGFCRVANSWWHDFELMPPDPFIIHQTDCFMSEPMLDSMRTAQELDRVLTREAKIQREDRALNEARRNL
jgi:hypothetical protein